MWPKPLRAKPCGPGFSPGSGFGEHYGGLDRLQTLVDTTRAAATLASAGTAIYAALAAACDATLYRNCETGSTG